MEKLNVPFAHGFYTSDSLPVSAQSCINFYPVIEDQPSLQQETLRGTPGIYHVANTGTTSADTNRGGHGLNGVPYFVFGTGLYRLESDETMTSLGTISGTKRCIFADNGTQLFIMQANGNGYIFTESPDTLTQITDVDYTTTNGTPQSVAFIDGYFVVTTDEKKFIVSALNDGLTWSALDFGTAESSPDGVVTPVVFQNQLFIGGERTIEAFTNIGGAGFPFTRSGLFLDAGISSVYSVVNAPNTFVWLGAGENEVPAIWMFEGNTKRKISTRAIDSILAGLSATKLLKVFAWAYSQGGNYFVGFNTHKNTTIVYDMTTDKWHERRSYYTGMVNADGDPWRAGCLVDAYGKIYVGDQYSHKVGVLDPDIADEMDAAGGTTSNRIYREFSTMPFQNDMKNMFVPYIELVVEGGLEDTPGYPESGVDPLCVDYACDALRDGIPDLVDHFWDLEESGAYYVGTPLGYHHRHTARKGVDMYYAGDDVTIGTDFSTDPVITDACYESWYRPGEVSGTGQGYHYPTEAENAIGVSFGYTTGIVGRVLSTADNNGYLRSYIRTVRDTGVEDQFRVVSAKTRYYGGAYYLNLATEDFDGTEYNNDTAWTTIGEDPTEGQLINLVVEVSTYPDGGDNNYPRLVVDFSVYVNGVLIDSGQRTKSQSNLRGAMQGTSIYCNTGAHMYANNAHYANRALSAADMVVFSAYYQRNFDTYTVPAWCPGPAP